MKKKIILSVLVILFVAAASLGATMAWFTSQASVENSFTAGTVIIDATETAVYKNDNETEVLNNVNPDDCYDKEITITNEGTKYVVLRMKVTEEWLFTQEWRTWIFDNWDTLESGFTIGYPTKPASDSMADFAAFEAWVSSLNVNTTITMPTGWTLYDGYYYMPKEAPGASPVAPLGGTIVATVKVCFPDVAMKNEFQKIGYKLTTDFEAIQASNNASGSEWGVDSKYDPDSDESAVNWDGWDFPATN